MTFEEACEIVKAYGGTGSLLNGLEGIQQEMLDTPDGEEPFWLTTRQKAAYRIVCREMCKLFF